MTGDRSRRGASSTSRPRRSASSPPSAAGSSGSASPGSATRALAERHGVRPSKALGQHFLVDANLARAIARDAGVGPGTRVAEIGAGMGALTVALAEAGATEVLAIEFDRALIPALRETTSAWPAVRVEQADATRIDWTATLGAGPWVCCANLPYNVGTSIVLDVVALAEVDPIVVMVQREVAERLAAGPGSPAYGVDSVRVACRATARLIRDVPPEVFWPRPHVGSAVVRFDRLASPVGGAEMGRVVDAAFAHRRKTIRSAVRRLAPDPADAERVLAAAAVDPSSRPEQLGVAQFAAIAEALG